MRGRRGHRPHTITNGRAQRPSPTRSQHGWVEGVGNDLRSPVFAVCDGAGRRGRRPLRTLCEVGASRRGGRPRPPVYENQQEGTEPLPYEITKTFVRDGRGELRSPAGVHRTPLRILCEVGASRRGRASSTAHMRDGKPVPYKFVRRSNRDCRGRRSEATRAVMNDTPVGCQNREWTEPQRDPRRPL